MEDFKIELGVELKNGALDSLKTQIEGKKFNPIKINIDTSNVQKQIDKTKKQSCQANLFLGAIAQLRVPLPSLPEQQEIVRILDDLLAKENAAKEAAEAVIEKIDLMKKSILARAFRGEL